MKIKSLIKPSNGKVRNVTILGTLYAFENNGKNQFVAQVDDERHAEILLESGHFVEHVEPAATKAASAKAEAKTEAKAEQSTAKSEGQ